jgi:hypothetical protein
MEHWKLTRGYRRPALFTSEFRAWCNSILRYVWYRNPFSAARGPSSREVFFGQPDSDGWRRPGLAGPLAGDSRHGSPAEFARRFGLLEAVRDKVLILRPPFGLSCVSVLKGGCFFGHMDHSTKGSNAPIDKLAQSRA